MSTMKREVCQIMFRKNNRYCILAAVSASSLDAIQ